MKRALVAIIAAVFAVAGLAAPISATGDTCGCTYTQGYWKTHSDQGPAPYDDGWKSRYMEEDTPFYNSGKTWLQTFRTPPAGNPYYILAHQYMAAQLNIGNGASAPQEVYNALYAAAKGVFSFRPDGDVTLSSEDRRAALYLAPILADYNEGLTGPGHCSE